MRYYILSWNWKQFRLCRSCGTPMWYQPGILFCGPCYDTRNPIAKDLIDVLFGEGTSAYYT